MPGGYWSCQNPPNGTDAYGGAMKKEEPGKGVVTYGTAATCAAVFACIGIMGAWAVLDGPAQELIVDNGSVADWIAAVGTWAVGYMAWRISVRSQEHNEIVQKRIELESDRATDAKVALLEIWVSFLEDIPDKMDEFVTREEERTLAMFRGCLLGIRDSVNFVDWKDPAWEVLGAEATPARLRCWNTAGSILFMCEHLQGTLVGREQESFDPDNTDGLKTLTEVVNRLKAKAEELGEQIANFKNDEASRRSAR